jgi:hypothetical protein
MYQYRRFVTSAGLALAVLTVLQTTSAEEHREHGAHVHGIGHLNVVVDGNILEIELDSPAANLVGFEHKPHSEAEHEQHEQAFTQLRQGEALFVLPAAAACRLESADVAEEGEKVHHAEEEYHHHEEGDEEGHDHSDILAQYRFHCDNPEALDMIDISLFEQFPATEKLEVQYIGPNGQGGGELTTSDHQLRF